MFVVLKNKKKIPPNYPLKPVFMGSSMDLTLFMS